MADYYTKFSVVLKLPTLEARQYAVDLAAKAKSIRSEENVATDFPVELADSLEDWDFETEPEGDDTEPTIWLYSENGGIDSACSFLQHLLQKFCPNEIVTFEWCHDCSKPRVDAYGGGAAIVTATDIKILNTFQWLAQNTPSTQNQ